MRLESDEGEVDLVVRRMLEAAGQRVADLRVVPLEVTAGESRVFDVRVSMVGQDSSQATRAVLKRYRDEVEAGRVGRDAEVLRRLTGAGVSVPRVLGALPQERALLLEHAGEVTLADLLKRGEVRADLWRLTVRELAILHRALATLALTGQEWSEWSFTREQRRDWALAGLQEWERWSEAGMRASGAECVVEDLAERLAGQDACKHLIWGDCNPKNVVVGDGQVRLIDIQPKRSSVMLDLVLLMAFADAPAMYVPRSQAHGYMKEYWAAMQERGGQARMLAEFLGWYDDELLWRILVYGGNLLRKHEARLACWAEVCSCMAGDLRTLLDGLTSNA